MGTTDKDIKDIVEVKRVVKAAKAKTAKAKAKTAKAKARVWSVNDYKELITGILVELNTYTRAIDLQIYSLASALVILDACNRQISGLDNLTVWEETRYGKKLAPHPICGISKNAQELVTRQMKQLGLTVALLSSDADSDPMAELTKQLLEVE